jgi:Ni,Fe-hydrogenase III component G
MAKRSMITYPTRKVLGVIDDPAQAREAAAALVATGVRAEDVHVLVGEDGRRDLATLGSRPNLLSRATRVFQFMSMDQLPDFLVYERAIEDGRAVVAVHVADRTAMQTAREVLERFGAHFLNHFGRLSTEELSMWRGPEPEIPGALRR